MAKFKMINELDLRRVALNVKRYYIKDSTQVSKKDIKALEVVYNACSEFVCVNCDTILRYRN